MCRRVRNCILLQVEVILLCVESPDGLLLGKEGVDESACLGALGGSRRRSQPVLLLDAQHAGVHRLPLPLVLQLQVTDLQLESQIC